MFYQCEVSVCVSVISQQQTVEQTCAAASVITDHHRLFIGCDRNYQHCITLHQKTDLLNHQCSAHHVPVKEIIFQFLDCTYLV